MTYGRTIGERLRSERNRLGYSIPRMAVLADVSKNTQVNWEAGQGSPTACALMAYDRAGADVLFIVTGRNEVDLSLVARNFVGVEIRRALAQLDAEGRRRLLLDLLSSELLANDDARGVQP